MYESYFERRTYPCLHSGSKCHKMPQTRSNMLKLNMVFGQLNCAATNLNIQHLSLTLTKVADPNYGTQGRNRLSTRMVTPHPRKAFHILPEITEKYPVLAVNFWHRTPSRGGKVIALMPEWPLRKSLPLPSFFRHLPTCSARPSPTT